MDQPYESKLRNKNEESGHTRTVEKLTKAKPALLMIEENFEPASGEKIRHEPVLSQSYL